LDSEIEEMTPGTKLGPYEILAPLGAGGMGEVYKARDTRLDRTVAIKVSKEQFSERFSREARAIAALNHPHICTLHDVGPNYLVMEYIEGTPLKGPLPLEQAMKYAAQICDALDAAHKKGITHRDLKPANILVTKAGVKLLDFGLARIAASPDETMTMAVMGTPAYMAPEQWEGKPGDARSDIYALGCVLYEILTGKRAAQDLCAVEPPAVEHIIKRCLEKDPDDRWQSARDLRHAIELPMSGAMPVRSLWRERGAWMAATLALMGAIVWLSLWRGSAPSSADLVSFAVYPPEETVFSPTPNTTVNVPQFALSPDGRTLAFVASATGAPPMLWLRSLAEGAAHRLPGTENVRDPFWSPNSRWLGFYSDGTIKKVAATGGAVQVVAAALSDFRGGAWGPDDTILFSNGSDSISRVGAAGGSIRPVSVLYPPVETLIRYPSFLPDGRHFLYSIAASVDRAGVYTGSLDDKSKKLLLHVTTSAVSAPPGYLLFVNGDTLMAQAFDAQRLEVSGQPFFVAEHAGRSTPGLSAVAASRNGAIAYAGTLLVNGRLTWFDRGGKPLGSAGPEGDYVDFRLSPNERFVAASLVDAKVGTVDIWITDLVRGNTSRFTSGGMPIASVAWSHDSARLIYRHNQGGANQGGANQFVRRSASGGGAEELLLSVEAERAAQMRGTNIVPTDWSPDGEYVLFIVSAVDSGNDLWILPLAGDKKPYRFLATPAEEMQGNFSPEGHFVAYTSNESGKFEVYVETFPRSERKWPVSINGGYEPRWSPDGREMYYLSEDRKLMAVSIGAGPSFGVPVALFQTRVPAGVSANRTHYVPSRDGKRFLVNTLSGDRSPTPITVVLNWTVGLKK
jgi:serine/threonine protein kinase